jgi:hypothetical protein
MPVDHRARSPTQLVEKQGDKSFPSTPNLWEARKNISLLITGSNLELDCGEITYLPGIRR